MSNNNLQQVRVDDRIRFLIFKYKGELARVAQETGVDLAYIQKVYAKLKKKRDRDTDYHIAGTISMEIIEGHDARVAHIRQALQELEDRSTQKVSSCCKEPVRDYTWGKTEKDKPGDHMIRYICETCQQECMVFMAPLNLVLYQSLIDQWMKEDQSLATFAEKMGLTFKPEDPPAIKNYNLFVNGTPPQQQTHPDRKPIESRTLDKDGQELLVQAEQLPPGSREKLRKNIETQLLQGGPKEDAVQEGTRQPESTPDVPQPLV